MGITVIDLIRRSFVSRSREEKERIVKEGKPRPQLMYIKSGSSPSNSDQADQNSASHTMSFDVASYDHVEWMTGCDVRQSLFCWPCLLFKVQKSPWNSSGIDNLSDLRNLTNEHQKSVLHMQAILDLQLFAAQITTEKPEEILKDKDLIIRNRGIARRLIDVICFLVSRQNQPRMCGRNKNAIGIEDCLENLQFLRDYDLLETSTIDDAITMLQITPKIVTDMTDAITDVMKAAIIKEIQKSSFVSMVLTQHSEDHVAFTTNHLAPVKSQFSTVLRYLSRGEVCERFIGFTNAEGLISRFLSPKTIFQHIHKVITEFEISRRIIAYSLDGSILSTPKDLSELQNEILFSHPYVFFVPCYDHKLDFVLLQSLSFVKGFEDFLKNLKTLISCFEKGSKMIQLYESFRASKFILEIPGLDISCFPNLAEFFNAVKAHRRSLVAFFDTFSVSDYEKVTRSDLVKMIGLKKFLTDSKTVFLIEVLIKIFDLLTPLVEAFNNPQPGFLFGTNLINSVIGSLNLINIPYSNGFVNMKAQVFCDFENEMRKFDPTANLEIEMSDGQVNFFTRLYIDIFKCIGNQVTFRFENARKLSFCHILNLEESGKWLNPDYATTLITTYGQAIHYTVLEKEIKLLLPNKPPVNCHQLLKFFLGCDFGRTFPHLYRICELILTLPSTLPDAREQPSKLYLVDSWSYKPGKHEVAGDLSLMCIEHDLLKELRQNRTFYDEVMSKFQEKNDDLELELDYKNQ